MKVREAVERIDSLVRNTYTREEKLFWLSNLDAQIAAVVLDGEPPSPYKDDEDLDQDLLVEAPFDMMYIHWLEAQIAYTNGEIDRYNNAMAMFNQDVDGYNRYRLRHKNQKNVTTIKYF